MDRPFANSAMVLRSSQGISLDQHPHGTDFLEPIPVIVQPLAGACIRSDQEERAAKWPAVRSDLNPPWGETGGANGQYGLEIGCAKLRCC